MNFPDSLKWKLKSKVLWVYQVTFFQDGSQHNKWDFLQWFHVFVSSTHNLDLGQADNKCARHTGLPMVPVPHSPRNVTRHNSTWRRQAVIRKEYTTRLHFKLKKQSEERFSEIDYFPPHCGLFMLVQNLKLFIHHSWLKILLTFNWIKREDDAKCWKIIYAHKLWLWEGRKKKDVFAV